MFDGVRAANFNFDGESLCFVSCFKPRIARDLNRIDRVRHDGATETKVVFSQRIADAIPGIVHRIRRRSGIAQRLFDRVDPQIYRANLARQFAGNHAFPRSRQTAEDDQQRPIGGIRLSTLATMLRRHCYWLGGAEPLPCGFVMPGGMEPAWLPPIELMSPGAKQVTRPLEATRRAEGQALAVSSPVIP